MALERTKYLAEHSGSSDPTGTWFLLEQFDAGQRICMSDAFICLVWQVTGGNLQPRRYVATRQIDGTVKLQFGSVPEHESRIGEIGAQFADSAN